MLQFKITTQLYWYLVERKESLLKQNYVVQQFDEVEINDLRFENTSDKS